MPNITAAFVELLYNEKLDSFDNKNKIFLKKALSLRKEIAPANDWRCNTFSTYGTSYELLKDTLFEDLVKTCEQQTDTFAKEFGVTKGHSKCMEAWINVAEPGAYQEYHNHANSHFSLVYYVETPENSGNIVFSTHAQDMFPVPNDSLTHASFKTYYIEPKAGEVVIFRSNLRHMVEVNKSNFPRVSIAMNMKIIK